MTEPTDIRQAFEDYTNPDSPLFHNAELADWIGMKLDKAKIAHSKMNELAKSNEKYSYFRNQLKNIEL